MPHSSLLSSSSLCSSAASPASSHYSASDSDSDSHLRFVPLAVRLAAFGGSFFLLLFVARSLMPSSNRMAPGRMSFAGFKDGLPLSSRSARVLIQVPFSADAAVLLLCAHRSPLLVESPIGFPCNSYLTRQNVAGYGRIRQDTAGYSRIWQETAGWGRIRQEVAGQCRTHRIWQDTTEYGSIRQIRQYTAVYGMIPQDMAGYGRIRQDPKYLLVRTTKTTNLSSPSVGWCFILFLPGYCDVSS